MRAADAAIELEISDVPFSEPEGNGSYAIWHTTTPEPSTLVLAGIGALAAGAYALTKRKKSQ